MSESGNGGNNLAQPPKKEMSMEVRLLLAFILMGAVMFLTPYIFPTPAKPPAKKDDAKAAQVAPAGKESAGTPAGAPAAQPAAPTAEAVLPANATQQKAEPAFVIDTDLYRITLSNQGATVRSWRLKKYKGNDNKPLELVNTASGLDFPFSLHFPGQKPAANVNWAWYKQTGDPDGLGVTYEFSDGHVVVRKVLRLQKNSYLSMVCRAK